VPTTLVNQSTQQLARGCVLSVILEGTYELKASREKVWDFIINPNKIGKCLPDLKALRVEGEDKFAAIIRAGVGAIRTDFKFRIEILEKDPINRVQIRAVGSGSGTSITIDTAVELKDVPVGSELTYRSEVKIAGIIAALGQRVIKDTADKIVGGVFECVKQQVE
jgi:carbon monoxide dehydrogenase subunit G